VRLLGRSTLPGGGVWAAKSDKKEATYEALFSSPKERYHGIRDSSRDFASVAGFAVCRAAMFTKRCQIHQSRPLFTSVGGPTLAPFLEISHDSDDTLETGQRRLCPSRSTRLEFGIIALSFLLHAFSFH